MHPLPLGWSIRALQTTPDDRLPLTLGLNTTGCWCLKRGTLKGGPQQKNSEYDYRIQARRVRLGRKLIDIMLEFPRVRDVVVDPEVPE